MKKLNREVVAKNASRFFLVLMSFLLILSLCSATAPSASVPVNIQNPDNIPNDLSFTYYPDMDIDNGFELPFGVSSLQSDIITVYNGLIGGEMPIDIPDGDYLFLMIMVGQPEGYSAGVSFNGEPIVFGEGIQCYYSDNPTITVIERDTTGIVLTGGVFIVPLPPSPTDSITNVWTSITNWVISSLNTVQGVFYGSIETRYTPDYNNFVVVNGNTYYSMGLFDFETLNSDGAILYNGDEIDYDVLTTELITDGGISYTALVLDGVPAFLAIGSLDSTFALMAMQGYSFVSYGDTGLTLLGTLAVIGLSISLAFLVIGVISRFLKLRG